jgi:hypothetical protein
VPPRAAYPRGMAGRWLIGALAFWVAFPAVSVGGPAYLLPIALVFVAWSAVWVYAAGGVPAPAAE